MAFDHDPASDFDTNAPLPWEVGSANDFGTQEAPPAPVSAGDFRMPDWSTPQRQPNWLKRNYHRLNLWVDSLLKAFTLPDDDDSTAIGFDYLIGATPPWLISLILHMCLMIVLGLSALKIHTATQEPPPIEVQLGEAPGADEIYAEKLGEQLDDPTQLISSDGPPDMDKSVAALSASELPMVDDPFITPPKLNLGPGGMLPNGTGESPVIGLEFSGREIGMKKTLLKVYGGTALTEDAVKEALAWLTRQQRSRGIWSLKGPYRDGSVTENEEAATAMALLAYQGAGYTPKGAKGDGFTRTVTRGWHWLLRRQSDDGHFFPNLSPEQQQLYTQALCTIALCELYGMTRDEQYLGPAQKAVDYCVSVQAPEGGWRYQPGIDSDLSVTGWFSMALQSARMAGIEVPSPAFDKISKFLDSVAKENGSRYSYRPLDGATTPLSAEGLLTRQYLGWQHDDPRLRAGVDTLLEKLPQWNDRNVYYWYYGTQVCHHMEGVDWQTWNSETRQLLPEHQEKRGAERGSWDPNGDRWGKQGGRLYVTCLSTYVLEVYYRHLPIYQHGILAQ